ncbi:MAG TPA: hypothetical protein VJ860_07470, partial [Polyangia bacterium]|nr:hypothetical protein [Polyangia bacterium]
NSSAGGTTGAAGATGMIGTGGAMSTGGALPSCNPDAGLDNAVACGHLVEAGGTTLNTNFTADVTVTAVAGVASGKTPCSGNGTQRMSVAAADGRTWNLDFNVTGLPANFIRTGDALGLTVASWVGGTTIGGASVSQSVVVTRGGKTILITWTGTADALGGNPPTSSSGAPAPVTIAGVSLTDDGRICESYQGSCWARFHRALVTVGASSTTANPGRSVSLGGLQIVLQNFQDVSGGMCDGLGELTFAAFAP